MYYLFLAAHKSQLQVWQAAPQNLVNLVKLEQGWASLGRFGTKNQGLWSKSWSGLLMLLFSSLATCRTIYVSKTNSTKQTKSDIATSVQLWWMKETVTKLFTHLVLVTDVFSGSTSLEAGMSGKEEEGEDAERCSKANRLKQGNWKWNIYIFFKAIFIALLKSLETFSCVLKHPINRYFYKCTTLNWQSSGPIIS